MDFPIPHQTHCPLAYQSLLFAMLQSILYQQQALIQSENNSDHSKIKNESVKKSLEKLKNVLGEERKNGQAKNLHKRHVYKNCYELRSRAIEHQNYPENQNFFIYYYMIH